MLSARSSRVIAITAGLVAALAWGAMIAFVAVDLAVTIHDSAAISAVLAATATTVSAICATRIEGGDRANAERGDASGEWRAYMTGLYDHRRDQDQ